MRRLYAVVPTAGRTSVVAAVTAAHRQVDQVFVIWNGPDRSEVREVLADLPNVQVVPVASPPLNISAWWNLGLELSARMAALDGHTGDGWDVAILNDDAIVPDGWVPRMSAALDNTGAVLAYPRNHFKITGWAFVLRGESHLRADESLAWWFSDDDLERQAEDGGGVTRVRDAVVTHLYPNELTNASPELREQALRDEKTYLAKWGGLPGQRRKR